jgi:leader peptidase (prepilin peptidase) / N-methyltransferase
MHGKGFWIRPILIELGLAIGIPALYWFETQYGGLLPEVARIPQWVQMYEWYWTRIFIGHAVLVVLMTAATFIDFDEQTIPDIITIPGTILALLSGSVSIYGFMPTIVDLDGAAAIVPVTFELPWTPLDPKWSTSTGLLIGLAIWTGWCFALADRRLILRRGWIKAIEFFFAGLVRFPTWKILLRMWLAGLVVISIVYSLGQAHWHGLFSALIGLAVGGSVVWIIRIIASWAMGVEAMGFGDVTLMAMIGAVIGWQAALAAFFLSPIAAMAIVLVQFIITRESRVPFGPYLCAGTMITIIFWPVIYDHALAPNLFLGQFLVWLAIAMGALMGVFLYVWRLIKQRLFQ